MNTIMTKKQANRAFKRLTNDLMNRYQYRAKGYLTLHPEYVEAVNRLLKAGGFNYEF